MTCPHSIDAIFARKATAVQAHALYEHLDGCAACRAEYDRHLLFEALVPADRRVSAEQRLRPTLPLARPLHQRTWIAAACALAAAACVLLTYRRPNDDSAFHARGPMSQGVVTEPTLEIYRLKGGSRRATSPIDKDDDLAFAYTNPNGAKFLLVFAVDEGRRVYWYYPAWSHADETPASIAIRSSSTPVELGEGIRHDFTGHRVRIYAMWSDTPMTTREAEARLVGVGPPPEVLGWPRTTETSRLFEVR